MVTAEQVLRIIALLLVILWLADSLGIVHIS